MATIRKEVHEYLLKYDMNYKQIDLDQGLVDYIDDMRAGLSGEKSSLLMLPSYIHNRKLDVKNSQIICVDAGGTNLRVALVSFDENTNCVVHNKKEYRMLGLDQPIHKDEFFAQLAKYIEPLLYATKTIVISFAYPTVIMPNLDGQIIKLVKEIKITGIEGCMLGEGIKESLAGCGVDGCEVYVINDTIATCLAGIASSRNDEFDSYIGLVLGTGTNTCYFEKAENIKKIGSDRGSMMVNAESGNYNKQLRGYFDILFDQTTVDPGQHTLEKMAGGGYLGALIDSVIRLSEDDGLFSKTFYDVYREIDALGTVDFAEFENDEEGGKVGKICTKQQDITKLHCLFEYLVKRAAKLVALQIAGAAVKCGRGKSREKPICVIAEGSTYHKLKYMESEVENYLNEWLRSTYNIHTRIFQVDDAVLKGCAIAGLLK